LVSRVWCVCGLDVCYGSGLESTQTFNYKEEFSGHGPGVSWGLEHGIVPLWNMVWGLGFGFFLCMLGVQEVVFSGLRFWDEMCGVWNVGLRVWGLRSEVWFLGFEGLEFGVWGLLSEI
jgi:hypothetical protein